MGKQSDLQDKDSYDAKVLKDYEEVWNSFRMLADIRFKLLALVPTVSAVAFVFITSQGLHNQPDAILGLSVGGFLVTLGIAVYNQRNSQLMSALRQRGCALEKKLNFPLGGQFSQRPDPIKLVPRGRDFGGIEGTHDLGLALIYSVVVASWVFFIMHSLFFLLLLNDAQLVSLTGHGMIDALVGLVTVIIAATFFTYMRRIDSAAGKSARAQDANLRGAGEESQ